MDNVETGAGLLPHSPLLAYPDLGPSGGRVGPEPEDFQVDEVPLYAFSGNGEHQYLQVRKRLLTTPDVVRRLARAAGLRERDIGYAGLKDKHAVTTQWFSVLTKAPLSTELDLGTDVTVLAVTRHDNKLRTGHLLGNRFTITLLGVEPDAAARAQALADRLRGDGLPNYFGAQRFGHGGRNVQEALRWLASGARGRNRFEQKLYPSVVQSELFNRYLSARLALGREQLLLGEVVRLEGAGAMFRIDDVEKEQPRLSARDLHLTGPMVGPKMRPATDDALALEQALLRELGLDDAMLDALGRLAPGTRRDLFAPLNDLQAVEVTDRAEPALKLSFTLPAGGYATEVIRQLTHAPWLAPPQTTSRSAAEGNSSPAAPDDSDASDDEP